MPPLEHKVTGTLQLRTASPSVREELEHWERLVFSFDMDKDNESSPTDQENQGLQPRGSRSTPSLNQPLDGNEVSGEIAKSGPLKF